MGIPDEKKICLSAKRSKWRRPSAQSRQQASRAKTPLLLWPPDPGYCGQAMRPYRVGHGGQGDPARNDTLVRAGSNSPIAILS